MRRLRIAIIASGLVLLAAACDSIRVVKPSDSRKAEIDLPPTMHINPCDLLERPEMEVALATPLPTESVSIWRDDYACAWSAERADNLLTGYEGPHGTIWVERHVVTVDDVRELYDYEHETIDGLGRYAVLSGDDDYGELAVLTENGALLVLSWGEVPTASKPGLRARLVDAARMAATRLLPLVPGEPSGMPPRSQPPSDLCSLVPGALQHRITGWTVLWDPR